MTQTAPGTVTAGPAAAPPIRAAPHARDPRADELRARIDPERLPPGQWPAAGSVPVSVLAPVKNEQSNIVECLRRLLWASEIAVIDSNSRDETVPLAQAMGADVYQFRYSAAGWPKKKNWALEHVPWRHEWVLIVDADEHITPELAREIEAVITGRSVPRRPGCGDGYWINRRFMFMGKWLRYGGWYPSYNLRLFRHAVGRYERIGNLGDTGSGDNEVHEHPVLSTGDAGYLEHDMLHYAYPDLSVWVEKHNRYTTWEAHAIEAGGAGQVRASPFGGLIERRRWLKARARRLPCRPTLRFIYNYIFQRGFLDGYPGFVMARLMAWYELMSTAKHREMRFEPSAVPTTVAAEAPRLQPAPAVDETGQLLPEASPWSFRENLLRAVWMVLGRPLFRLSFHNWYGVRRLLLRVFGARVGRGVRIRPSAYVEIPWNIELRDGCIIGDHAILYSLGKITVGERAIVSQYAHLCAGTHDHTDRRFPLIRDPIEIGPDAWIGADAFVGPNVHIGRLSVLGARASAYKDLEPRTVYVGNPARALKRRELA